MQRNTWQDHLKQALTSPEKLCQHLGIPHPTCSSPFAFKVPWPFIEKMQPNNPNDPLLLQVLTQPIENQATAGFSSDPLQESHISPTPGVLHKYHGRALITLSGGCAIHCRYCFRRAFDYHHHQTNLHPDSPAYQYICNTPSLHEIILSGGDPLLYPDQRLKKIIENLAKIPHLKRVRIHTRLPIVIPQRITQTLAAALTQTRLQAIMVIHCNHPQELDDNTAQAFKTLKQAGMTLLNQSVLLKNINDNAASLITLSETLFEQGVLPYYLHTLDTVVGSAHFQVTDAVTEQLYRQLLTQCPGYLVPKLVSDGPGHPYKQPWPITHTMTPKTTAAI
jgi:L-lysine 2,3-aminomutase